MPADSRPSRSYTYHFDAPTEDDVHALSVDGFDEEDLESEKKPRVPALEGASPIQAVVRFFQLYANSRGYASKPEFMWGLAYGLLSTIGVFWLMAWMGSEVEHGGDSVSSLFRTVYMLMMAVAPLWLIVHITPVLSLNKRFKNYRSLRSGESTHTR